MIRRRIGWYWAIFDNTPALNRIHQSFCSSISAQSSAFAAFFLNDPVNMLGVVEKSLDDWAIFWNGETFYRTTQAFFSVAQALNDNAGENSLDDRALNRKDDENNPDDQVFCLNTVAIFRNAQARSCNGRAKSTGSRMIF